ncbi:MAG: glutaredoxin family protein [Candidatus Pacebacteria bacterium]|jgi:glutaredoxin|nr:glutaredoxin family protein [Candidatus Paceibacterota bacterium]
MLILYTKDNCLYCERVKKVLFEKQIAYDERNIKNEEFLKEVREKGARTMPFLFDTSANVTIGESDEIIDYVSEYSF